MGRGKSGSTTGKSDKTNKGKKDSRTKEQKDDDSLMDLLNNDPDIQRGGLGSVLLIRQKTKMSKEDFDKAALRLRREGKVVFAEHPHVASLKPDEVNNLISDGKGAYFNGITLRNRPR
jgi:hypothetical protein